jgi:carbon-monoxide dehydrogenase large subunit
MSSELRPGDHAGEGGIGDRVDRREDPALLKGTATFVDDINERGMLHMAIHRSRFAHAEINDIDTEEVEGVDEVVAVYTADDLEAAGVPGHIPPVYRVPDMVEPRHPIIASDRVRHQGKPVAVVVAEDRYVANRAVDRIDVDYERLDPVVDPYEAMEEDSLTLHEEAPDNLCFEYEDGDKEATGEALNQADHTVEWEYTYQRLAPSAIEPRGMVADYDSATDDVTIRMPTQNPFLHQTILSDVLDHPQRKVRVITPHIGGSFASKSMIHPEENLTAFCAMQLEAPVKYIADRTESFQSDEHGRGLEIEGRIGVNEDGTIRGVQIDAVCGLGASLSTKGTTGPTAVFGPMISGQYAIPNLHYRGRGVFTTATPASAYRGVGRAPASFTIERLVTLAAREIDMDPAELRRKNFIPEEEFPYETAVGSVYDSGTYQKALDLAMEKVDYEALRERQVALRNEERYLGIGISTFVEPGGFAPSFYSAALRMTEEDAAARTSFWENGGVRMHETGEVTVNVGTASPGTGTKTAIAQVVADTLEVDLNDITVLEGTDTRTSPQGAGTSGSRNAVMGGNAVYRSAQKVHDKARRIAAHQFEAAEEDVELENGEFRVAGAPDRSMAISEVAAQAYLGHDLPEDMEPGLEATTGFNPPNITWAHGAHIVVVEVNPDTGEIDIDQYAGVDDCGVRINPKIVEGQEHGGAVAGLGAALYEGIEYDESGNLLTASFQDYALARAHNVPELNLDHTETPSPSNPLGVKGKGEAGAIGTPQAVVNAVTDALRPFGVDHIEMPLTAERVWRAANGDGGGL